MGNTQLGTTGYRFVVGTGVAPEGWSDLPVRYPDGCRTQPPRNCTWQIVFTRSPLVAELFLPSDFPAGEYVFGFTLQDGRSADTVFSTGQSPRAAPRMPPGLTLSIETAASAEDVADIQAGIGMAAWYLRERAGPDRPRTVTVNISSTPYRGEMLPGMQPAENIAAWSRATRNGTGAIYFNLTAAEWNQRFPYDTRVFHQKSAAHEYVHTWMADIGCYESFIPAWLREGTAEFMGTQAVLEFGLVSEARVNAHLATIRSASLQLPLKDLERALPVEANPYTVAHLAVRRLMATTAQPPAIRRWCELVAGGLNWQDAFFSAFGLSVPDFYRQFEEFRKSI